MVEMDHIYEDQAKAELAKDPEPRTIEQWLLQGEKDERFTIEDIAQHGCEGGVGGLIYYSETVDSSTTQKQKSFTISSKKRYGTWSKSLQMTLASTCCSTCLTS